MIALFRSIAAIVIGYIVFAASAFMIFQLSGQAPHAVASLSFMVATVVAGMVFALAGGYIAAAIAGRRPLAHSIGVAALLTIGAGVSLASTLGHGAVWSQVAALFLMAPSAVLGGWMRARRTAPGALRGEIN